MPCKSLLQLNVIPLWKGLHTRALTNTEENAAIFLWKHVSAHWKNVHWRGSRKTCVDSPFGTCVLYLRVDWSYWSAPFCLLCQFTNCPSSDSAFRFGQATGTIRRWNTLHWSTLLESFHTSWKTWSCFWTEPEISRQINAQSWNCPTRLHLVSLVLRLVFLVSLILCQEKILKSKFTSFGTAKGKFPLLVCNIVWQKKQTGDYRYQKPEPSQNIGSGTWKETLITTC